MPTATPRWACWSCSRSPTGQPAPRRRSFFWTMARTALSCFATCDDLTSSVPPDSLIELLSSLYDITFTLPPTLADEDFVVVEEELSSFGLATRTCATHWMECTPPGPIARTPCETPRVTMDWWLVAHLSPSNFGMTAKRQHDGLHAANQLLRRCSTQKVIHLLHFPPPPITQSFGFALDTDHLAAFLRLSNLPLSESRRWAPGLRPLTEELMLVAAFKPRLTSRASAHTGPRDGLVLPRHPRLRARLAAEMPCGRDGSCRTYLGRLDARGCRGARKTTSPVGEYRYLQHRPHQDETLRNGPRLCRCSTHSVRPRWPCLRDARPRRGRLARHPVAWQHGDD